jgi:hypothetical protein
MPSRGTLHNWKESEGWDEKIKEQTQQRLQRVAEEAPEVDLTWDNATTESVLERDLQRLYEDMRKKLQASDSVPRPRDLIKLAETLQSLAKSDRERVAWMKRMASTIIEAIVSEVDDAQLTRIRSKVLKAVQAEEHRLMQ